MNKVRKASLDDFESILELYKKVAPQAGGVFRHGDEITPDYVRSFMEKSTMSGIELVVFNSNKPEEILAEIHCYKPDAEIFSHVLTDTSIVVDPKIQRQGVGKLLFNTLLQEIRTKRKDILRLELIVKESNHKAIAFYRSINFRIEGRLERRLSLGKGRFESHIPMAWFNPDFENK